MFFLNFRLTGVQGDSLLRRSHGFGRPEQERVPGNAYDRTSQKTRFGRVEKMS